MSQQFLNLSKLFDYDSNTGFKFTGPLAEIIPKELQNLKPSEFSSDLDLSFLDEKATLRAIRKIDGLSDLGDLNAVTREIAKELKNYFSGAKADKMAAVLMLKNVNIFSYDSRPLTMADLKQSANFNINKVRLNKGFNVDSAAKHIKTFIDIFKRDTPGFKVTKTEITHLQQLHALLKTRTTKPKRGTSLKFTSQDREIFFNKSSVIKPETISRAHKYWENISKGISSFIQKLTRLEDMLDEKDPDAKKYLEFVKKEKYDFLQYVADYPSKNIQLANMDKRVNDFIYDYLQVYNIVEAVTGPMIEYSESTAEEEFGVYSSEYALTATGDQLDEEIQNRIDSQSSLPEGEQGQRRSASLDLSNISEEIELDPEEMTLGPLAIIASKRSLNTFTTDIEIDFFKSLANMKMKDVMTTFSKSGIPFTEEDIENFTDFMINLDEYEEEGSGFLPIFMADSPELSEHYPEFASNAKDFGDKIQQFFGLLQRALEKNNTVLPQNIDLKLFGTDQTGFSETGRLKIPISERISQQAVTQYKRQITPANEPSLQFKDKEDIDFVKDIIDDIETYFYEPTESEYTFGLDLDFTDIGAINILMTYGSTSKFEGANRLYSKMIRRGTKTVSVRDLVSLAKIMKKINTGFNNLDDAKNNFIEFIEVMSDIYDVEEGDSYYNKIVSEAASMLGALKAITGDKEKLTLEGMDVDEAYAKLNDEDFSDMSVLKTFIRFFNKRSAELYFGGFQEDESGGKDKKSAALTAIKQITDQVKNLKSSSPIKKKLLEAHDNLRILKKEPVYYGRHDLEDYDSVQTMINKMHSKFNRDISASEINNIVEEIDSFDSISKAFGISKEEVYFIKANFR